MAKKKKGVTIGLNDLITQPRKMSRLPMLDSRIGVRTLLAVLQRLQGLFNVAKANERDPQLYMKFVTDEFEVKRTDSSGYYKGDVVFQLNLSDIAEPNHYPEARVALESLTHVNIMAPIPEKPGYYRTVPLMNITGAGEERPDGSIRFTGTDFEVVIPRITAENILDINLLGGYTRFLLFTASQFRSDYAYSLYIRLSDEWRRSGNVFDIGYEDLRRNMGFVLEQQEVKNKDGKKETITIDHTNKHSSWSLFCKYVLNQSKEELDKMAAQMPPKTDFTFEYEGRLNGAPLPRYKRPDAVRFTIIPTSMGKQLADDSNFASQSIIARKMMTSAFNLTEGQARSMMKRVTPDNVDALIRKMHEMQDSVRSGRTVIRDSLAAWALTCIREFLSHPAEEVKSDWVGDGSGKPTGNAQPTANSQEPFNSSTGQLNSSTDQLVNSSTSSSFNALGDRLHFTPDEEQRLQAFKNDCKADATIPAAAFKSDIEPLQFHHASPNGLFIVLYNPSGDKVTPGRLHYHSIYEQVLRHWHAHFPDHTINFD